MEVLIELAYDTCPDHTIHTEADLTLDKAATGPNERVDRLLMWLARDGGSDEGLARILASTVALYQFGAGNIAQCLDTAIIWERG